MPNKPSDINRHADRELLVTLLRSDQKADNILQDMSIEDLIHAHRTELQLTPRAYERLQASIELGRRINETRSKYRAIIKIESSSDAIEFCQTHFQRLIMDALQE